MGCGASQQRCSCPNCPLPQSTLLGTIAIPHGQCRLRDLGQDLNTLTVRIKVDCGFHAKNGDIVTLFTRHMRPATLDEAHQLEGMCSDEVTLDTSKLDEGEVGVVRYVDASGKTRGNEVRFEKQGAAAPHPATEPAPLPSVPPALTAAAAEDPSRSLVPGALAVDTCRVGMAVKVTSERAALVDALKAVGWESTIKARERTLGQTALVKGVEHAFSGHACAILEVCNGRNGDIMALPKSALTEVPQASLGAVPSGWARAEGGWRHEFTGEERALRPVHRAEDPAAVQKEFAERDARLAEERAAEEAAAVAERAVRKEAAAAQGEDNKHLRDSESARLCNNCGFGTKKNDCVLCGKWAPHDFSEARLCKRKCAFGNRKQNCIKCGEWTPMNFTEGRVCRGCGFGNDRRKCAGCRDMFVR